MPPKMDRAEALFDAVQETLDANRITSWKPQEMEVFLSLLETYYTELKTRQALAKRGARCRGDDQGSASDDGEADEEEEDEDEEDVEALQHEAAVADVDRALTKLRLFLQKRVPFGSIQEPSITPYDAADDRGQEQEHNEADKQSKKKSKMEAAKQQNGKSGATRVEPVVYSVDSFLYLEEDIEELTKVGAISRHYCTDCGSTNLAPTEFITHSFSQDQLIFLSCFLLPALGEEGGETSTRSIVDVGSRLGIALWACYFAAQQQVMTKTERVIGVELDKRFVQIQQEVGKRFCPRPVPLLPAAAGDDDAGAEHLSRVGKPQKKAASACAPGSGHLTWSVVESDCFVGEGAAALADAGVVILHNVFEYFCATEVAHLQCWLTLRSLVAKKGQILICAPSIEETFMAFSEEALESCGILAKDNSSEQPVPGQKRSRVQGKETDEGEEEFAPAGRKELAIAKWIADYLEPIEDEVEQLAEEFIAFRTAMLQNEGEEEEAETQEHGHNHGHGGCCSGGNHGHSDGHGHSHGNDGEGDDDCCGGGNDGEEDDNEPTELEEQIRNIWVYRVK